MALLNQYGELSRSKYENPGIVARIGSAEMDLASKFTTFHQDVLSNFYRLAGHIYSGADLRKLKLENRPDFEWNLFLPIILSIVGNFKAAIPGVDFYGITPDDHKGATLQKALNEYGLNIANDISYELSKAFLYAVVGKIGWLKTTWGYSDDPEGMAEIRWYDSLRLKFDVNWQRRDTKDLRFMSDAGWYEANEIIQMYAKKDPSLRDEIYEKATLIVGESALKSGKMKKMMLTWAERFLNTSLDYQGRKHGYDQYTNDINYQFGGTWYRGDGRFKVVDWYEKRLEPRMEILDLDTGKKDDITDDVAVQDKEKRYERDEWFDRDKLMLVKERYSTPKITQVWDEVIWQTSIVPALNLVLHDDKQKYQSGYFKFVPVLCFDFHPDVMEYKSIMDHIVDPVSSYNLRRNTMLTYLMKMANGGYLAEQGAVKGFEDELLSNEIGGLKKVQDGALTQKKIIPIAPAPYPEGLSRFNEEEKSDLQMISGSTPNVRGQQEISQESGVLFEQKVQQADIMQEWISDNAQAALVITSKNLIAMYQRFMTMPRMIMLLRDDTDPYWIELNKFYLGQILNNVSYGRYNVRVSKQPYGRYARDKEYQKQMQMDQYLVSTFGAQFVDPRISIELSGLSSAQKMIQHINQVMGDMQMQMKEAELMQSQMDDITRQRSQLELIQMVQGLESNVLNNRNTSADYSNKMMEREFMAKQNKQVKGNPRSHSSQLNNIITK